MLADLTIFSVLVPPDLPIGSPMVSTMRSPGWTTPARTSSVLGLPQQCVAVAPMLEEQRAHVAVERHLALRSTCRRQRVDRHAAVQARHPQRGRARCGQRGDRLDLEVVRGEQRRHRDRLVDAREHAVQEVAIELDRLDFSASTQICAIDSTVSTGYLPAAVSAESITASVPSSTALATSETSARVGTGLVDHRLHHLRRGDGELVVLARHPDHAFLQRRHRGVADLDREVAARHHDAVGGVDDVLQRGDRLGALDLGDQQRRPPAARSSCARHVHVGAALRERTAR